MGACCSPTLANIFLSYHEKRWLDGCPSEFKPVLYRRYVDDCFLLFRKNDHIPKFHDYLNSQHTNIKFTVEVEHDDSLPFLDVHVKKSGNAFVTDLYRKPTFTGLGMKHDSSIDHKFKTNLVNCLIDRAYKLSSTYYNFINEVEKLKKYFCQNNFPLFLIENLTRNKINSLLVPKPLVSTVDKNPIYASIPFISNTQNRTISSEIQSLIKRFYAQINLRLSFKNDFSIGSLFSHKDKIPSSMRSNVVYSYHCNQCSDSYYGETSRHLRTRIAEHRGLSYRTGVPLTSPPHSSIRDHAFSTGHDISTNNFKVIFSTTSQNLRTSESILINKFKPSLNSMESSIPLHIHH